ncbi:hypothetical protein GCM10020256_39620 [Streptomyces thermocoprophilus]
MQERDRRLPHRRQHLRRPAQPQPSFTDTHFNPALVGTEKKNDTPTANKAVRPPAPRKSADGRAYRNGYRYACLPAPGLLVRRIAQANLLPVALMALEGTRLIG